MSWPTVDGLRVLKDAEADLAGRAILELVDHLMAEGRDQAEPRVYGIDWFDQWDWDQRLWLLEQIVDGFFTAKPPPSPAAMLEATVDAVFCEVLVCIETEIDQCPLEKTWRRAVVDAFVCQKGRQPSIEIDDCEPEKWCLLVTQMVDAILGPTAYQKAELLRDGEIEISRRFLLQRGLPPDFLQRIPPLRQPHQTENTIKRIREIL